MKFSSEESNIYRALQPEINFTMEPGDTGYLFLDWTCRLPLGNGFYLSGHGKTLLEAAKDFIRAANTVGERVK
jgi:hypothetical protein